MKRIIVLAFLWNDVSAQTLDSVTVTATLKSAPVSGRNITVVPGEAFNRLPVWSLDELLKYVPGIEVQQRGPAGSQADIVLRGGTFQQVLVILDGIRLNDPNTGHFNAYIPITPSEIDRIEILKGAASAIYGSDAVGGVINIITRSFAGRKDKNELTGAVTGGGYGLWSADIGGIHQKNNNTIAGGALLNNAGGQPQRGANSFYHNNTVSFSAAHDFNANWRLAFRSAWDRRDFSAQNFYTTFKSDTATEAVETFWNQASLTYNKGGNSVITDAGYRKTFDNYAFNTASSPNKNFSQLLQAGTRWEHGFSASSALIAGIQYQHRSIRSNDRGDHTLDQLAAFIIWNQTINHFFLSPAIRLDRSELVPQLNLAYKIRRLQLRASAGRTVRQADFTERYNNYNKALVTSGSIGNPNLAPERSFSYEAGADLTIKSLKIASTVFRRDQSQLIDYVTTAYADMPRKDNLVPTGTYALAENIAKVNVTGFETDIRYMKKIRSGQLTATLGTLWLDSKNTGGLASFYLSSHAKFLANGSVVYSNRFGSVSLTGIYKTRAAQTAPAINAAVSKEYFLMNMRLAGFVWKQKANLFVEAQNIFNITYSDLLGAPMPGRWLSAGLQVKLSTFNHQPSTH